MCVNNLPKVVTWKREAGIRIRDLRSRKSNALTTTPPCRPLLIVTVKNKNVDCGNQLYTPKFTCFHDDLTNDKVTIVTRVCVTMLSWQIIIC